MTDDQKRQAIVAAIQSDAQLIILIRLSVTNSILNVVPTATLDAAMAALGLPTS